ncbi:MULTISPECIES: glycosyltransferase [Pseudanabaena]|uniref:glycosyltransferase n=1 Tax=Pseudanabaena TaxID=1152 RepID=UPI002478FA65|nr:MULTISPECIES: glycosyltransferase [Pseudanabaena]MEA5486955.1 glycosyltransferase [Pseudanabaena sp. CCNP1317]WGS74887.1 glycosyltransferase [Pseudanabaena galeata CCNP1313]
MLSLNRQAIALISDHADPAAEIGSEEAGGQNVYVRHVGETLAALGWQVDMFTRKSHPDTDAIVQHSPHCRTIRLKAGMESHIPRDRLFELMPEFLNSFQAFQKIQGINYPLVHTNYWLSAWVGMELQKTSGIQLVHTYHSLAAVKYQSLVEIPQVANTRLRIEREILEQANCVVATSPQEQETLRSLVSTRGQIEVIPCGTDITKFHPSSQAHARAKLKLDNCEKVVLYVGRFDERKGIETLVRAFAILKSHDLKNLKLIIVGGSSINMSDGAERNRIENLIDELGLRDSTVFAGRIGHDILPLYYTAADVCVIPSHYEPFGLVAIEAMACGVPVVASNVGGLKFTIIHEETGLLVEPKNNEDFANSIHRILFDELWVRKMRKQSSANVNQHYSWTGVTIQLSELYRHVLARSIMHEQAWSYKMPSMNRSAYSRTVDTALLQ